MVPAVAVFGVGHVGLELARVLARHDLELHLVDSRADQLADERLACLDDALATVHVHHAPVPELVLGSVPAGTHVLVLTHDHAEDFALCDAALRCSHLGSIGLIGSAAKWARFRQGLRVEGHAEDEIDRITTPIGSRRAASPRSSARSPRSSRSPSPPRSSRRSPPPSARGPLGDDLPGAGPRRPGRPVHRWCSAQLRRLRAGGGRRGHRGARSALRRTTPRPGRPRGRPARRLAAAGAGGHPRALPAGPGHRRAGHAAAGVARPVRPAGGAAAGLRRLRRGRGRGVLPEPGRGRDHHRAGLRLPLRRRGRPAVHRSRSGTGCGSPAAWWSATAACPSRCSRPPSAPTRSRSRSPAAGTATAGSGTPSPPASRSRPARRCSRPARPRCPTSAARGSPPTSTRTSPRWPRCAGSSGPPTTTPAPTTAPACSASAPSSPTTCTPPTSSCDLLAERHTAVAHCPSSNSALGSGLFPLTRHVDHGVRGRPRLRRRRRHRLLAVQGGAAGVLHAAAARSRRAAADRRPTCSTSPPPPAPARWAWPTGPVTCRWARSSTRSACGRSAAPSSTSACATSTPREEALGKIFALASDADVADVWVGGQQIASGGFVRGVAPGA